MPDIEWNGLIWGKEHDWSDAGEAWSGHWGGSEAQWYGSLYPRLHRILPACKVLEIATGFGRWTRFMLPKCDEYVGVDLSENCVRYCRNAFAAAPRARFHQNDGLSLAVAEDGAFDAVISLDSLVHVELDVMHSYLSQTLRKLKPTGVAFIHHSNMLEFADQFPDPAPGFRARSVSAALVREIIEAQGGRVFIQEVVNWGGGDVTPDCFTTFARNDHPSEAAPVVVYNRDFHAEAGFIANYQSHYGKI